jgi:hypothetical protein
MIKRITKDELEQFFAQAPLAAEKLYDREQAEMIGSVAWANDDVADLMTVVAEHDALDELNTLITVFVYAFQLGREYELFRVKESLRRGR